MRGARGGVLALAIVAAGSAAVLVHRAGSGPSGARGDGGAATVEVLVAARGIATGETIGAGDMRWQAWPKAAVIAGSIRRQPGTPATLPEAMPARYPILAGEPIVEARLARPGQGGVLASLVAPGMRAVSVPIRDETAAGGFIQPHDRVDVLLTRKRDGAGAGKGGASEMILRGAKVLAIGRGLDGRGGNGGNGSGSGQVRTATLELTPVQARRVAAAQSAGELSLALVAASDAERAQADGMAAVADAEPPVSMLKFGRRQGGGVGSVN